MEEVRPPVLPELDDETEHSCEVRAEEIVEAYYASCVQNARYLTGRLYLHPEDTWLDRDRLAAIARRRLEEPDAPVVHAMDHEVLLALGDHGLLAEAVRLVDEWWERGGDDPGDFEDLIERLEPFLEEEREWAGYEPHRQDLPVDVAGFLRGGDPAARRWFEARLERLFARHRNESGEKARRAGEDLVSLVGFLRDGWAQRLLTEEQRRLVRRLYRRDLSSEAEIYADWTMEILRAGYALEDEVTGIEILEDRRAHTVFFSTSWIVGSEGSRWGGHTVEAAQERGWEKSLDLGPPYDMHHWRRPLLLFSLWFPEQETTRRLAALALQAVSTGRPRPEHTLAAAVAWRRTTAASA